MCRFLAPIEAVGLLVWWVVDEIRLKTDTWWLITTDSLGTVLTEWAVVLLVFIGLNWWMKPLQIREPKNPTAKKILGFFVRLKKRDFKEERTPAPRYTPKVRCGQLLLVS